MKSAETRNRDGARVWRDRASSPDPSETRPMLEPTSDLPLPEYRLGCMRIGNRAAHILDEVFERSDDGNGLPLHFTRARQISFDDVRHALLYEGTVTGGYFARLLFKWLYKHRTFDD